MPSLIQRSLVVFFSACLLCMIDVPKVAAEGMLDLFSDWHFTGTTEAGDKHFIARDSIVRAPHSTSMYSFYMKILFDKEHQDNGRFYDEEIADMVIDCSHGRMDTLSIIRYFKGIKADQLRFNRERSQIIKVNTLGESELRLICGKNLPRYIKNKDEAKVKGSGPWR